MMEAPRRALTGLALAFTTALFFAPTQDAKTTQAEIKKVEEKIQEETERVARKKDNLKVEFTALMDEATRTSLRGRLAEIGGKHRDALKQEAGSTESKPVSDEVRAKVQEEVRAALAATVGRNLSTVLDAELASNLIEVLRGAAQPDYQFAINETVVYFFSGDDFEANYRRLMPTFEQRLNELNAELAALKQKLSDADADARARAVGAPAGMVLVPAGKYRIGSDEKEFTAIRQALGYGAKEGNLDKYQVGWPPHEVQIDEFYIDVNEVTNKQWAEFVRDTGHKPPPHWTAERKKPTSRPEKATTNPGEKPTTNPGGSNGHVEEPATRSAGKATTPPPGTENLPVTWVTMDDIAAYCEWVGRRLPTEFEWEAAARFRASGDKSNRWWTWGDKYDRTRAFGNNQTAIAHKLRAEIGLTPIGTFPEGRSVLGINDLVGNAGEVTSSPFLAYPNWQPDKVPGAKDGKDSFNKEYYVMRGGTALASELQTLTTTRIPMVKVAADLVGFRTALSKVRGKDFIQSVAGGIQLNPKLEALGPALKDEKGRPSLAVNDPGRFTALMAGGWDAEKQLPARASFIGLVCRDTLELTEATKMKSVARDQKKPLMLGYFTSAVDFTTPAIPKGAYWIMWAPERTKVNGKEKTVLPEGLIFQSVAKPEESYDIPRNVNPVFVPKSTEYSKLTIGKGFSELTVLMSFPVRDKKDGRFIVELHLQTAAEALKPYK